MFPVDCDRQPLLANMIAVFASVLIVIFGHNEGWGKAFNDGING